MGISHQSSSNFQHQQKIYRIIPWVYQMNYKIHNYHKKKIETKAPTTSLIVGIPQTIITTNQRGCTSPFNRARGREESWSPSTERSKEGHGQAERVREREREREFPKQ
jgi:hypothetical protein